MDQNCLLSIIMSRILTFPKMEDRTILKFFHKRHSFHYHALIVFERNLFGVGAFAIGAKSTVYSC